MILSKMGTMIVTIFIIYSSNPTPRPNQSQGYRYNNIMPGPPVDRPDEEEDLADPEPEDAADPEPVDGGFSDFGDWSECSEECGGGTQTRSRTCTNPAPANGGSDCVGVSSETRICNEQACDGPGMEFLTTFDQSYLA